MWEMICEGAQRLWESPLEFKMWLVTLTALWITWRMRDSVFCWACGAPELTAEVEATRPHADTLNS